MTEQGEGVAVHVYVYVCLRTILYGGSSNIQREAMMEPCGTPGACEPSAAPRLIPQQTFQTPLDQPRTDRREGIVCVGQGGFFYPSRVHQGAHGWPDRGVWLHGWWRFSAEGGLGAAVNRYWAES